MRSEADPKFLLKYTDVYVGEPSVEEDSYTWRDVTPFECRLRDCTYSAPIYVNVLYTRGKQVVRSEGVQIGRIPVMLRSSDDAELRRPSRPSSEPVPLRDPPEPERTRGGRWAGGLFNQLRRCRFFCFGSSGFERTGAASPSWSSW